jgi:hypothetical protein
MIFFDCPHDFYHEIIFNWLKFEPQDHYFFPKESSLCLTCLTVLLCSCEAALLNKHTSSDKSWLHLKVCI